MAAGGSPLAVPAATAPTSNPNAVFEIVIAKERQKFACAHFTVFPDGTVERLHGHNYHLGVTVRGRHLAQGLLVPFQTMKAGVAALCDAWDEHVFVATVSTRLDHLNEATPAANRNCATILVLSPSPAMPCGERPGSAAAGRGHR